jgi:hypothetical protein
MAEEVCGAVVWMLTCVLPLPAIDDGLKLQLLRLPAGEIVQEFAEKLTVPVNPLSAVRVRVTGFEV